MLKVLARDKPFEEGCTLLLGGFDGLHVGHKTLVDEAKKLPYPVGITSISGGKEGGDVFTFEERERVYADAGISFVYEIVFTEQLKNTSPEAFAEELFSRFRVKALFCGSDFRFGRNAAGTPGLLAKIAPCPVEVRELKKIGGEKVSSSEVKRLLAEGNVEEANELLCGGYFLSGRVEHGRRVGRTIGFPTLNLTYPKEKFPVRDGVYGGYAETETGAYPAIVNFGARPTFGVEERKVEAYLDGFDGDLYGQTVRVYPQKFYRPVRKFSSAEELSEQLERDKGRLKDEIH